MITAHELQGVGAGFEVYFGLSLSLAEMPHLRAARQRLREIGYRNGGDQQVMVSRVRHIYARRGDAHALQAEFDREMAFKARAIHRTDEINFRTFRRG